MQRICALSDLEEPTTRSLSLPQGEAILVRWQGQVYAYRNACPHLGLPLNFEADKFFDGEERYLQCHNHMALFEADTGHCVDGPCRGDYLIPIRVEVRNGAIYLAD